MQCIESRLCSSVACFSRCRLYHTHLYRFPKVALSLSGQTRRRSFNVNFISYSKMSSDISIVGLKGPSTLSPINLLIGRPSPRLQAADKLAAASQVVLLQREKSDWALTYGPDHGEDEIREHVATWLSQKYRPAPGPITQDRIIITNGASGGLTAILQKFTDPLYTRRMFLVEPAYFLAINSFLDAGFGPKMQGVPEDDEGIDLEFLRRQLEKEECKYVDGAQISGAPATKPESLGYRKLYKYALYVVPTLSNPSGKTMSLHHRKALVELARKYDILLIADDVYDFLAWPADDNIPHKDMEIPPRLADIDRQMGYTDEWGNTVSNGSFSKLAAPGLRVGWCEATPSFVYGLSQAGATHSGGCQSQYTCYLIDHMLVSGILEDHVQNTLIPIYRKRYNILVNAIKTHLYPLGIKISTGSPYETSARDDKGNHIKTKLAGGFFMYLDYPDKETFPPAADIVRVGGDKYGLNIAPGEIFVVNGDPESMKRANASWNRGTRLCWAWNEEDEIIESIQRLANTIQQLTK
ncbi:PLP-dependent transferase [Annulohypoxylon maeteangense]|uniref:PLP-dependent transferase n=1 Tax=Annulohypoxylon maeteangense TaxID=1927788 RepID=UPI002008E2CE|nr:PLP-dependent transferase [Annulohypoxylon maeteangense]KAI0879882.1 PLP-dependent transferase [Annulohypoxylon maeteangense]